MSAPDGSCAGGGGWTTGSGMISDSASGSEAAGSAAELAAPPTGGNATSPDVFHYGYQSSITHPSQPRVSVNDGMFQTYHLFIVRSVGHLKCKVVELFAMTPASGV
jgi:hypothetical protein